MLDVIRCDEAQYLVWKWRPDGDANSTRKENAIRWGSSLRVKAGEVAVFVYKQENGPNLDFIEGPFDDTIKTANFPVISNLIGMAYAGKSPFQAEIYFINLEGNIQIQFRTQWFLTADPRFQDFPVKLAAEGSFRFNISDYRSFIQLYRLINFDVSQLAEKLRDAVLKNIKSLVANAPVEYNIPVLQIERRLLEINDLITPRISKVLSEEFGVNLRGFDLSNIEIDQNDENQNYERLRQVTADLEIRMREQQNEINIKNLAATQTINAENMSETLRIQREQAERLAALQTQQQFLAAHQINQQTAVLSAAANNLGAMGQMNLGSGEGGGSGGGFNPVGVMTGLAIGGAMGGQMGNMMNAMGQNIQAPSMTPPPPPMAAYHVSINGQNAGPFNISQLQQMVTAGQLLPNSHVWKAGMANWELVGNVAELAPLFIQTSPPPPPPSMPPMPPQDS